MLTFALLAACSGGNSEIVGDSAAGEVIYTSNCAACHGADGTGSGSYPDLTADVPEESDAEIEDVVLNGEDAMPSFDLDEQEMADLLAYLRASFG